MKFKNTLILMSLILILILSFGCSREQPKTMSFGYQPFGSNFAFFVAMEKGFFEEQGLTVNAVKIISANDAATAMIKGDIVGNATLPLNVLLNVEESQPGLFKIFLVKATSEKVWSDYILVRKGSEIDSIEKLKDKKVGGYPGSAQQALLKLILGKFMDDSEINTVEMPPATQLQGLESEQIDALLTYDELAMIALDKGIAQVLVENPIGKYVVNPLYGFPYVLSSKFVKQHPQLAKKVRDAMYKAVDFINENNKEAREIMAKWTGSEPQIAMKVNLWDQVKVEDIDKDALQKLADIFVEAGIISKKIDTSHLYLTEKDF